ncbi:hypothetical protein Taro_006195 [Colocasia esculenta]|uniref:Uncharacterized protein n=1 Tax=Colocasia esculenta TaxID=4460 RepID=A0A843TQH4_COLES|nr:hypothetical protein [Colocasia esculenta]
MVSVERTVLSDFSEFCPIGGCLCKPRSSSSSLFFVLVLRIRSIDLVLPEVLLESCSVSSAPRPDFSEFCPIGGILLLSCYGFPAILAPEVVGDDEAYLDISSSSRLERAGKRRMVDSTSYGGTLLPQMTRQMRKSAGPIASGGHASLPGVATDDGASAFAEFGVSTEQYSFAPVEAYIPMSVEEYSAIEPTSVEPASYNPGPSDLPPDGGALDPLPSDFFSIPSEFCVENFVETSISEVEIEERNSLLGNPPLLSLGEGESPALEVEALSDHGVKWPTRDQSSPGPADDDLWDFLLNRVRAVVDSEDPPPIEAVKRVLKDKTMLAFNSGITQSRWMEFVENIWGEVCHRHGNIIWAPYDRQIRVLESDLCSLANDGEKRDSRIAEMRRCRKSRKLKITTEMENIVRLQREIEEACSSLDQKVTEDIKDSEEEATLLKDDHEHHRSVSFKTKEVDRLKRKKPFWLRFGK